MNIWRPGKSSGNRPRRPSSRYVTTSSGRRLRVNRSLFGKMSPRREAKSLRKAQRASGQPKSRIGRFFWRLHPKRLKAYWLSRDGGISALKITGLAILVMFVLTLGVFAYFRKDLPDITDISGGNLGGSISYYDRTGKVLLWQDYNAVKRVPVASDEMSQHIKDATIATEDRNFYSEKGFNMRAILRAAINNTFKKGGTQGGSTITQQLVKITSDWTEDRTVARKVKELILAIELERTYTKDEILTGYLNAAPYGGVDHGVQAAASDYFHKSAKQLNLAESAMLATIPKAPGFYSPYSPYFDKAAFTARYNYVLDSMVDTGAITKAEAAKAKQFDILATVQPQQTKYAGIKYPYFVLAAKNELTNRYFQDAEKGSVASKKPNKVGGWKVYTTLDIPLQDLADQQAQKGLTQVKRQGGDSVAMAAEDVKTGQMVAVVGGTDFTNKEYGEINYAQTPLPPGSSFKPYDYTALIENTNTAGAGAVLYDIQQALPGYPCTNKSRPPPRGQGNCLFDYDFKYPGPVTLRYGLGGSRNVPAVKAMLTVGVDKTIKTAESMGLRSGYKCYADEKLTQTTQCYGASSIGDGAFLRLDEHTNGFATLSRMGNYIPRTYILKIYDVPSESKPMYEFKQPKGEQVVRDDSAYIVTDMISDPKASYFPSGEKVQRHNGWHFGMKTGTTNDAKDGLLMGMSTKYALGVWVGHHTRRVQMRGFMETMTRPIWKGWMFGAHANIIPVNWSEPSGIQHLPAYVVKTHIGVGSVEPSPSTDIYPAWYKPRSTTSQSATIDKVSNKLATDCTPPLARQTEGGNSSAEHFSTDVFYGLGAAGAGNTSASDDVHSCGDAKPSISLTVSDGNLNSCEGSCTISAAISAGTHPFDDSTRPQFPGTVNFLINGQVVKSIATASGSPLSFTYIPTTGGTGTVTAQVVDSVLYEAGESANVTFSVGGGGPSLTFDSAIRNPGGGGSTQFSWSGGNNPYIVYNTFNPAIVYCPDVNGKSCSYGVALPVSTSVTVRDDDDLTANITVTN